LPREGGTEIFFATRPQSAAGGHRIKQFCRGKRMTFDGLDFSISVNNRSKDEISVGLPEFWSVEAAESAGVTLV
jgi:hypothetical protein